MCVFEMSLEMSYVRCIFKIKLENYGVKSAIQFISNYIRLNTFSVFEEQCVIENCREVLETLKA